MFYDRTQIYANLSTRELLSALNIPTDKKGYCLAVWRGDHKFGSCKILDRGVYDFADGGFKSYQEIVRLVYGLGKTKDDYKRIFEILAEIAGVSGEEGDRKKMVVFPLSDEELEILGISRKKVSVHYGKEEKVLSFDPIRDLFLSDKECFYEICINCAINRQLKIQETVELLRSGKRHPQDEVMLQLNPEYEPPVSPSEATDYVASLAGCSTDEVKKTFIEYYKNLWLQLEDIKKKLKKAA